MACTDGLDRVDHHLDHHLFGVMWADWTGLHHLSLVPPQVHALGHRTRRRRTAGDSTRRHALTGCVWVQRDDLRAALDSRCTISVVTEMWSQRWCCHCVGRPASTLLLESRRWVVTEPLPVGSLYSMVSDIPKPSRLRKVRQKQTPQHSPEHSPWNPPWVGVGVG